MKGEFRRIVSFVLAVFLVIGNTFSGSNMVIYASSVPMEMMGDDNYEQAEAANTVAASDENGMTDESDETTPVIDIKLNGDYQSFDGTIYCAQEAPSLTVTDNSADGISNVTYTIMADGVEIVKETQLSLSDGSAMIDMPDEINDSVVKVSVAAVDKDGNNNSADISFVIDRVKPVLSAAYDNVNAVGTVSENDSPLNCDTDIYNSQRKVTITVMEKNFSASKLVFEVSSMDKSGENESITKPELIWNRKENSDIYTAEYTFSGDAYYKVKISAEDMAGNPAISDVTEAFLIDTQKPDTHKVLVSGDEYTDYKPELNFVYSNKEETEVSLEGDDENSAVIMQYYISDSTVVLTENELDGISASDWTIYTDTFKLSNEGIYTIYARFVDMAGNRIYVHSSAYVIDRTAPELTVTVKNGNDSGVYEGNVTLNINSEDKKIYSGIKKIECDIYVADVYKETVTVYENTADLSLYDNIVDKIDIDYELDANTYNYDNIKIVTKVTDTAENSVSTETAFSIISGKPTVEYSYSGAALTRVSTEDGYGYYPDSRILTVDITCRTSSFDGDIATAGIVVTLNGEPYDITGKISQWTTIEDAADIDKAHHTAKLLLMRKVITQWA